MRKLRKAAGGTCAFSTRFSAWIALAGLLLSSAANAADPVANNDSYSTTVSTPLNVGAPGVLGKIVLFPLDHAARVATTVRQRCDLSQYGFFLAVSHAV